jgi:hypothetical protein
LKSAADVGCYSAFHNLGNYYSIKGDFVAAKKFGPNLQNIMGFPNPCVLAQSLYDHDNIAPNEPKSSVECLTYLVEAAIQDSMDAIVDLLCNVDPIQVSYLLRHVATLEHEKFTRKYISRIQKSFSTLCSSFCHTCLKRNSIFPTVHLVNSFPIAAKNVDRKTIQFTKSIVSIILILMTGIQNI